MSHSVGKLAALALVVGIGAAVVIHAQRNIPNSDSANEQVADDPDATSDNPETALNGEQEEPDDLLTDEVVPAVDKANSTRRTSKVVAVSGASSRTRNLIPPEDEVDLQATPRDPFADDDNELEAPPKKHKPAMRETASNNRGGIDILDMDDEPDARPAPQVSRGTRGSRISIDEPDSDELVPPSRGRDSRSRNGTGPRLAAGTDEPPEEPPIRSQEQEVLNSSEPRDESPDESADEPTPLARNEKLETVEDDPDVETEPATAPRQLDVENQSGRAELVTPRLKFPADDSETELPSRRREELRSETPRLEDPSEQRMEDRERETERQPVSPPRERELPSVELMPKIEIDDPTPTPPPAPKVRPTPKITIEKQAPTTAVLGRPMVYHIIVRNEGRIPAHQVVVEDIIPEQVQVDGSIPQAVLKDDRLTWKLGTLPAGQEKKIAVRVIPQGEGTIGGVATVHFAREPQGPPTPQLKFNVSAPRQATVESPVEFTFHVTNVGSVSAHRVLIRDVLPAGLRHKGGDDLEYNLGELPPGKSQDVKLELIAAKVGPTVNRVVVTADGNVTEEAEVELNIVGPTLKVSRSGPTRMFPGKTGTFTNTITNASNRQMTGINIQEKVPAGMKFVSAGEGGFYDETKRTVFWISKQLGAGESRTVTVNLQSVERGPQISVVRAADMYNLSGETTATVKVAGAPALTIELGEIPTLVEPGESIRIPARILNKGSDTATAVRATIKLPPQLKLISADGPTSYREVTPKGDDSGSQTIELHFAPIEKIDPKRDAVFELKVQADEPGAVHFSIQVVCEQLSDPIQRQEVINIVNQ